VEITDVRVYPVRDEKVRAFISIVFDRCFMVNDIKVIQGKDGLFVSMPSRKRKSGEFKDVAHPLNSETRKWVEERILGVYQASLDGGTPAASTASPRPPESAGAAEGAKSPAERSLEEVERLQFGDSFWGVS
jgi:stage V sporulation protein G